MLALDRESKLPLLPSNVSTDILLQSSTCQPQSQEITKAMKLKRCQAVKHRKHFNKHALLIRLVLRIMLRLIVAPTKEHTDLVAAALPMYNLLFEQQHRSMELFTTPAVQDFFALLVPLLPFLDRATVYFMSSIQMQISVTFAEPHFQSMRDYLWCFLEELQRFVVLFVALLLSLQHKAHLA